MASQLNDIALVVNNDSVPYETDTLRWKDGKGESTMRAAVLGGGEVEIIYSENLGTKISSVSFSMPSTVDSENLKSQWKSSKNGITVELIGPAGSNFEKIFTNMAVLPDPETDAGMEGSIAIEMSGDPAQ